MKSWIVLSLGALLLFSTMATLITWLVKRGYPVYFVLMGLSMVLLVTYSLQTVAHFTSVPAFDWRVVAVIFVIGLLSAGANLLQFTAMASAPNPGLVTAVIGLQAAVIAVVATRIFASQLNGVQIVGLVLSFLAILTLSYGASLHNNVKTQNEAPATPTDGMQTEDV